VLVGDDRLAGGPDAHGKDGGAEDRIDAGLMELVDLVEIEQLLDGGLVEAGLLVQLAQRPGDDPLAGLERPGDALPESSQDPTRRAMQQQDLEGGRELLARATSASEVCGVRARLAGVPEDPDVDQVGPDQSRSNRSTGRTKTVAPPTSTSSG